MQKLTFSQKIDVVIVVNPVSNLPIEHCRVNDVAMCLVGKGWVDVGFIVNVGSEGRAFRKDEGVATVRPSCRVGLDFWLRSR